MNVIPTLEVHKSFEPIAEAWAELEAVAPASLYQTMRWIRPWTETVGVAHKITPMLVLARAPDGTPVAIFPFGVSMAGGLRLAEYLGGKDSNANMPLFRPGVAFTRGFVTAVLTRAAQTSGLAPDAFVLSNQPETWEGGRNPMKLLPNTKSPSDLHSTALPADFEELVQARMSTKSRSLLRRKARKLAEIGEVSYLKAKTEADARRILDAMFQQKSQRLAQMGVSDNFDNPLSRSYFERACLDGLADGSNAIDLYGLIAGDRVVATYSGGAHRGRFYVWVNSFDMSPEVAPKSPGDLLLYDLLQDLCQQGCTEFDLGIGEARYKDQWCDRHEPLFDTLIGTTTAGRAFCFTEANRRRLKRIIKRSAWLWPAVKKLRSRFG